MDTKVDWIVETDDPDDAWLENFEKTGSRVWDASAVSVEPRSEEPAEPVRTAGVEPLPEAAVAVQAEQVQALAELDQHAIAEMLVQCRNALKLLKSSRSGHTGFANQAGSVIDGIDTIVPLLSKSRARVFSLVPQ